MSDKVTVDITQDVTDISVTQIPTSVTISDPTNTITVEENTTTINISPVVTTVTATEEVTTVDISPNITTVGIGDASIVASNLASTIQTNHDSGSWVTGASVQASFDNLATTADSRYVNVTGDTMTGALTVNVTGQVSDISNHDTGDLTEGTNLYYTTARFNTAFEGKSTSNLSEGTNLYYTDARADARISNAIKDEDNMGSNSATHVPSQQSVKAYVDAEVTGLVNGAPDDLNTLHELADALAEDANFSATVTTSIGNKLAKASNLSDLTNAETARTNLGLGTAATIDFDGAYSSLSGKPTLFSGSYSDLTNKPTIPTAFSGSYSDLSNKPTLFSGSYSDLSNKPTLVTALSGLTDVDATTNLANDKILKYNATASEWQVADDTGGGSSFDGAYGSLSGAPISVAASSLTISKNLLPNANETLDIGSTSLRFNDIYLAGSTIDLGGTKLSKNDDGDFEVRDTDNNFKKIKASEIELDDSQKDSNNKVVIRMGADGTPEITKLNRSTGAAVETAAKFGLLTVVKNVTASTAPTADGHLANKKYVDDNTFSGDYTDLTNKPTIPTAFSGDYTDLSNKPTLFSGDYTDLTNKPTIPTAFSGNYSDLSNKPTLFDGAYSSLSDKPTIPADLTSSGAGEVHAANLPDDITVEELLVSASAANWKIVANSTNSYLEVFYHTTKLFEIDVSGNVKAKGNITAYASF